MANSLKLNKIHLFWQLARMDKPIGFFLLWAPILWTLWIANQGHPSIELFFLFSCGTFAMRSAGCVMNDIADRHLDCHVKRTKNRPLTAGLLSLREALIYLVFLLSLAFLILLQLPPACFYYAIFACFLTFIYPFCKRFIQAPQAILGLAFSMGIPMVYVASNKSFDRETILLILINLAWTIAYDTQYAMVDRVDDKQAGIKSTAILFGRYDRLITLFLQLLSHSLWLLLSKEIHVGMTFYLAWSLGLCFVFYQFHLTKKGNEARCFQAFLNNGYYGLLMWFGLLVLR